MNYSSTLSFTEPYLSSFALLYFTLVYFTVLYLLLFTLTLNALFPNLTSLIPIPSP